MNGSAVNNAFYGDLGEKWYTATDDPVALLRAESRVRNRWLLETLHAEHGRAPLRILDVGCGGGFLANPLGAAGYETTGIDLSQEVLEVARRHDATGTVRYLTADARDLPFRNRAFEVVCAMDFLEHLGERETFLAEVARVLRPGGLFFFYTFNRNPISHLVAIKGVEWFVRNTPRNMHLIELFLKPRELKRLCSGCGMEVEKLLGLRPRMLLRPWLRLLVSGRVDEQFEFVLTRSLILGYGGYARKMFPRIERRPQR